MHGIFLSACVPHRKTAIYRPLGPYQVAWYLREHGYDIQVIDFVYALENDQIEALIEKFITPETKFIGYGMMSDPNNPNIISLKTKFGTLMMSLRKKYPQLKFIFGGPNIHVWSPRFANGSLFDYYVKGYGEDQTLALFNHVYKGTAHPPFEITDGNKHLPEHIVTDEIKHFKFNTSRHKWHSSDCIQPGESLPIEFARGCIFKCAFCRFPHIGKGKNDFTREMECIKEELIYNYENFGTTVYFVTDDTFNADNNFVIAFTEMSKSLPFKLQYVAYTRADLIHAHPEQEDMFLENGMVSTFFGIETFHPEDSKMVGKAWSGKHAKDYVPYLYNEKWQKQIHLTMGLIIGFPNEYYEDFSKVNQWIVDNNIPSAMWHPLNIWRGPMYYKSEFDLNAEKYGFKFRVVEGRQIWYTDHCDEFIAMDWASTLNNELKSKQTPSTWALTELSTLGLPLKETAKTFNQNINWQLVEQKFNDFLKNYIKDLWAL